MSEPYDVEFPRGRKHAGDARLHRAQRWLRPALIPASWVYRCLGDTVRRVRSLDTPPTPATVTVVSVGGIDAGGSGKTPVSLHLLERLVADGERAAYVSRGYRSRAERFDGVTIVADCDARNDAGVRWLRPNMLGLAREVGDEGAMIARRLPGVPLAFARDKAHAIDVVSRRLAGGYVVLDDAFQSWGVARDVDVVIVAAQPPRGHEWLLPAGTLREEYAALERADVLLFDGAATEAEVEAAARRLRSRVARDVALGGVTRSLELTDTRGEPSATRRAVVVSSIARPWSFEASLAKAGVTVVKALRYPDHHAYTAEDVAHIRAAGAACPGANLVTTEKDWSKLVDLALDGLDVRLARLRLRLVGDDVYARIRKPRA